MNNNYIMAKKLKRNRVVTNQMISTRLNMSQEEVNRNTQKNYYIHAARKKQNTSMGKFKEENQSKRRINSVFALQK